MIHNTSDTVLSQLTHRVATHLGLHFPPEHWKDLARGIGSAAQELGFKDPESCFQWLASTPPTRQEIEILSSHLTIGETYFFRERQSLSALEEQVLPDLLASRQTGEKRLRIWSAGCSTGEEP
jgi:chemotaxis protein methyltransferase CheR